MKYVKLFEDHANVDELKQQIQEYLNVEYTEDWFENEFQNRVNDYIDDDDLVGYGDPDDESTWDYETPEEAYQNLCTGSAIEYDLAEVMRKEICEKFNLTNDEYFYKYKIGDLVEQQIKDKATWCDPYFGQSVSSFFNKGVDDLMKHMNKLTDPEITDDGNGNKL